MTLGQAIAVALFSGDKRAVLIPGKIKEKQIIGITIKSNQRKTSIKSNQKSKKNKLLVSLRVISLLLSSMLPILLPVSALRNLAFFLFYHLIFVQYINDWNVSNNFTKSCV